MVDDDLTEKLLLDGPLQLCIDFHTIPKTDPEDRGYRDKKYVGV